MLPCRPCLSMLRCRESEASPARSDGAFRSAGPGPLLLRPAGGTGGRSFFDIAMLLLLSGRIQAHASMPLSQPRSGGLLSMARRRRSLTAGMPSQGGAHDVVEVRVPRVPAEYRVGALRIGDQRRRVARSARGMLLRHGAAADALDGLDHGTDRMALSGAEIERGSGAALEQIRQRANVRLGEVRHMNVIAHSGAVRGGVVGAVDMHRGRALQRG